MAEPQCTTGGGQGGMRLKTHKTKMFQYIKKMARPQEGFQRSPIPRGTNGGKRERNWSAITNGLTWTTDGPLKRNPKPTSTTNDCPQNRIR